MPSPTGSPAFTLVFAGCGAIIANARYNGALGVVGVGLVFGLVIMVMVYATGHLSGAHINPAVTVAFALTRHFRLGDALAYVPAQLAGATLAALILRGAWGTTADLGATVPTIGSGQALMYEAVLTGITRRRWRRVRSCRRSRWRRRRLPRACRSRRLMITNMSAADGTHAARSAGTTPADRVHPEVVDVMREIDIDVGDRKPQQLTQDLAEWADVVVTMGCGDACPYIPGKRYMDWELRDPSGLPLDEVRRIRDDVARRTQELAAELDS